MGLSEMHQFQPTKPCQSDHEDCLTGTSTPTAQADPRIFF